MKRMTKILALLLAMGTLLCACSGGGSTTAPADTSPETSTPETTLAPTLAPTESDPETTAPATEPPATTTAPTDTGDNPGGTAQPPEPTEGDEEPELYVVYGVWQFNEVLTNPDEVPEETFLGGMFENRFHFNASLNFSSNGQIFSSFVLFGEVPASWHQLDYGTQTAYMNSWEDEAYRTVDFGEYPQKMNEHVYKWFVANARRVSE